MSKNCDALNSMKICIINSSTEGIDSPFEKHDRFPDPNWYILKARHEFFMRYVTKEHAKQDIDRICKEGEFKGWDLYMNYMWGTEKDKAAGVEATKYLESKNVPILTNPSRFLRKTKLDLIEVAIKADFLVPKNTPDKYPKIVKYADGYGQLSSNEKVVCLTKDSVDERVALMKNSFSHLEVLVQDFIVGSACSVIVLEMGREIVALTPIQQVFPGETIDSEALLTWQGKFENVKSGNVRYEFVDEEPAHSNLKENAIKAFKALDTSRCGWARVDMRLDASSGLVYVIDVYSVPTIFYPLGNMLGDDLVVSKRFPGGQPALLDMLITSRQIQWGELGRSNARLAAIYDENFNHYKSLINRGTVLDVACGTGLFGELLHKNGVNAEITGIDLSTGMLKCPAIRGHYRYPVIVGPMQEFIMATTEHDHIVCFGGLQFLNRIHFNAVLARMFMLARKSITFEIDDISEDYIAEIKEKFGKLCYNGNNVEAIQAFGIPYGWNKIYEGRHQLCKSLSDGSEIWGIYYRFERASFLSRGDMWPI